MISRIRVTETSETKTEQPNSDKQSRNRAIEIRIPNESIIIMTKNTANSTITKMLLLNVRDLLRQHTCDDAHSQVICFLFGKDHRTTISNKCSVRPKREGTSERERELCGIKPDHFTLHQSEDE